MACDASDMNKIYQTRATLPFFLVALGLLGVFLLRLPDLATTLELAKWVTPASSLLQDMFTVSPAFRQWISQGIPLDWRTGHGPGFYLASLSVLFATGSFLILGVVAWRARQSPHMWVLVFVAFWALATSEGLYSGLLMLFGVGLMFCVHAETYVLRLSFLQRLVLWQLALCCSLLLGLAGGVGGGVLVLSTLGPVGLAVFVSERSPLKVLGSHLLFVFCVLAFLVPYVAPHWVEFRQSSVTLQAYVLGLFAKNLDALPLFNELVIPQFESSGLSRFVTRSCWVLWILWILMRWTQWTPADAQHRRSFWQGWAWTLSLSPFVVWIPALKPIWLLAFAWMLTGFFRLGLWRPVFVTGLCGLLVAATLRQAQWTSPLEAEWAKFESLAPQLSGVPSDCVLQISEGRFTKAAIGALAELHLGGRNVEVIPQEWVSALAVAPGRVYWDPRRSLLWKGSRCQNQ